MIMRQFLMLGWKTTYQMYVYVYEICHVDCFARAGGN